MSVEPDRVLKARLELETGRLLHENKNLLNSGKHCCGMYEHQNGDVPGNCSSQSEDRCAWQCTEIKGNLTWIPLKVGVFGKCTSLPLLVRGAIFGES
jgi:hypothetical protein